MALTKNDRADIEKVRRPGASALGAKLDDAVCVALMDIIDSDLSLGLTPSSAGQPPAYFGTDPRVVRRDGQPFWPFIEKASEREPEVVTYFRCLAKLHKARLKYANILRAQAMPTMDQVGPRGLLQFGTMSPKALTGLMIWRKWIFDLDNRAAQETGYLFEPIIANAIGGAPCHGSKSPVFRHDDKTKARQVDCVAQKRAYEFKLRVTIAASGQGRWREELEFPLDCRASGYEPVLIVFDPTKNEKLDELCGAFRGNGGQALVGADAWQHLADQAGPAMAIFLRKYVREPIDALLAAVPGGPLPELKFTMPREDKIVISVGGETYTIGRAPPEEQVEEDDA